MKNYLFKSKRLCFRNWIETDLSKMATINSDPKVMEFFPSTLTREQTAAFIERMQIGYAEHGFCYFAVDLLKTNEFIGFIGLHNQTFESEFTPCVDIGWRLNSNYWNKGYATEGAKKCLGWAFKHFNLENVMAIAPSINLNSIKVMKKIGMQKVKHFNHPTLAGNERLEDCVLYQISNPKLSVELSLTAL